jgi:chromosome segregation ATPase
VAEEDTWLRKFEQKRAHYQNNRTQELSDEFDQLPEIRDQLHVKQEHQIRLNRQGADIRNVYQELEAAAKQVAADGKEAAFSKYKTASQVIQQRQNELTANQQKQLDERQTVHESELAQFLRVQLQATATNAREASYSEQLKTLSALPAAQRLVDESQAGINEQILVVAELQKHLNAISAEVDGLSQERQARAAEYSGLKLRKNAQVESRDSLKRQINAGAETLLGFLRRHHPTWTENIARLIPVETLMRTDLNPAFLEEVQQNLYGVEINLEVLPLLNPRLLH